MCATEAIEDISILRSDLYFELEGEGWPLKLLLH